MSMKFPIQNLKVENFRAFDEIEFKKFSRINIFGGLNGVGKSSLLETLFFAVDSKDPSSAAKSLMWRTASLNSTEDLVRVLRNPQRPALIRIEIDKKSYESKVTKSKIPNSVLKDLISNVARTPGPNQTLQIGEVGLRTLVSSGSTSLVESYIAPGNDGFAAVLKKLEDVSFPLAQIISPNIRPSATELAEQVSIAIKSQKDTEVVQHLRILDPDVDELLILQDGKNPTVYVKRSDEVIPISLLGDGFRAALNAILAVSLHEGRILLLDEVDTALHFSITARIWSIISKAAHENGCQIFATSHSRESILNAAAGVDQAGRAADFTYFRLERNDGGHSVIPYAVDELHSAEVHGFEFR
ncbi:AAA family ATPase [Sulfitobacter mediterraneus]|uniref:AAA family ATPase n=1 Tax=Sulfitobacter mediterraneus TaxID=83219 RepID=UPI00193AC952|nr:AAA family ATPase [Sulfitobacter mediterraneus]MBM1558792.1 AAA family ATPase [Sulfitobacter mediterraneus]MBM1570335.1 AAA family ATPase [Sulfitobacter mediterraneus]MBM1574148.1 AAA family ATPase [Sulfitobacter mediterraneus]MBM1577949.1 AAA family ATPase [Sulfitobacter mediterraneus]MBM1581750.1 AAA family ATPase [Sulfitobacter mediterraneus]